MEREWTPSYAAKPNGSGWFEVTIRIFYLRRVRIKHFDAKTDQWSLDGGSQSDVIAWRPTAEPWAESVGPKYLPRCPKCGHSGHSKGGCINMGSLSDCECQFDCTLGKPEPPLTIPFQIRLDTAGRPDGEWIDVHSDKAVTTASAFLADVSQFLDGVTKDHVWIWREPIENVRPSKMFSLGDVIELGEGMRFEISNVPF